MNKPFEKYIQQFSPELQWLIQLSRKNHTKEGADPYVPNMNPQQFFTLLHRHKLTSLVQEDVQKLKTLLSDSFIEKYHHKLQAHTKRTMALTREMLKISSGLEKQNIPHLVLKGPVLSQILYADPLVKNSVDMDFLIPFEYIEKAHSFIENQGYTRFYPSGHLSSRQQQINYKLTHHYSYYKHRELFSLELHWNLINPRELLPLTFKKLYENHSSIVIANQSLKTISCMHYLIYLAVHGSKHRWYSLGWLKDFSTLTSIVSETERTQAIDFAMDKGLEKPLIQAYMLSHLIYHTPLPEPLLQMYKQEKGIDSFIGEALQAIQKPLHKPGHNKVRIQRYTLKLRKNYAYKFKTLFRLKTHHKDWEIIHLPDQLFFLYYPLRPLIYFIRLTKRKKGK